MTANTKRIRRIIFNLMQVILRANMKPTKELWAAMAEANQYLGGERNE